MLDPIHLARDPLCRRLLALGLLTSAGAARLLDVVDVKANAYGARGDGTTDDTAAIQAALNTGSTVIFPAGTYRCANLTLTTAGQQVIGIGLVRLMKNANGPILTISGDDVHLKHLTFRGESATPAFTGHNLVITGQRPRLESCGSRWAFARALLATGGRVQIEGSGDIWQTTDATGYDIEIGVSGTATLYHSLIDIYSSQAGGGVLLTDTGSHVIQGGQFGKLTIAAGTSPAGVNGGMTSGVRILGATTIGLASAIITGCQFSNIAVTLAAGTSGCMLVGNTYAVGATVTNNGNANNLIIRETSTGSFNSVKFGPDTSTAVLRAVPDGTFGFPHHVEIANAKGIRLADTAGTNYAQLQMTSGNNFSVANLNGAVQISASSTNNIQGIVNGAEKFAVVGATGFSRFGGSAGPVIATGAGTPEGNVIAVVGSLYLRTDGGAATTLYVKESGTGAAGWVAK